RLWKLLRKIRPQIVHTRNFGTVDCALVVRLAGGAKLIHSEHGWDMHDIKGANRRYLLLRRWMSLIACKCLSVSRHIRNWQREEVGIAPHKLVQIYNGVDHERFKPADRREHEHEHFVIGFVGRLEEVKNLPSLVRAVAHLGATTDTGIGLQVRLVGSGSMESVLRSEIVDAGLEKCVILDGPRSDIPQVMREFDVFVLPSFNEGISNTILEAMASGLPVIAADVGGNSELVEHEVNGLLYPGGDEMALAAMILRYADDEPLRHRHGQAARQRVEKDFTLEKMVASYANLYTSVHSAA
ncbi:MAG: glycosyltransferase, partial [Gammaproteobacteria bacterium]|nr:glycosyltransferase [Gammaproteobacteria bacterium]